MSAATMDRRLAPDRAGLMLRGRDHSKPASLLKDAMPIRAWAQWDDAVPRPVEIDLVGHERGNAEVAFRIISIFRDSRCSSSRWAICLRGRRG
jgi:hypothetical protein